MIQSVSSHTTFVRSKPKQPWAPPGPKKRIGKNHKKSLARISSKAMVQGGTSLFLGLWDNRYFHSGSCSLIFLRGNIEPAPDTADHIGHKPNAETIPLFTTCPLIFP